MNKKFKNVLFLALAVLAFGIGSNAIADGKAKGPFEGLLGMEFMELPAGTFLMGSPENEVGRRKNEALQHEETISSPFQIQTTEVTQDQWSALMEESAFCFKGGDRPAEYVTWEQIQEFILRLNVKDKKADYRLPTEKEWEYAARAGSSTVYSFGDDPKPLGAYSWYCPNATLHGEERDRCQTHDVGTREPNEFGLYDMHGNVDELVEDRYSKQDAWTSYKGGGSGSDVVDDTSCSYMTLYCRETDYVIRGGSFEDAARDLRSASRCCSGAWAAIHTGFRLVRMPEPKKKK